MSAWVWQEDDGVGFWRAAALEAACPCRAVFSSRLGGTSPAPYDSLNVGGRGDEPANVAANRGRLAAAVGFDPERVASAHQVHGTGVAEATAPGDVGEADALVTRLRHLPVMVTVADCVPVMLLDPRAPAAAVVHAGWRGTAAGVTARAAAALGGEPAALLAAIGPSAGPCCYEVSEPVISRLAPDLLRPGRPGHAYADLWEANRRQLLDAGLREENIHTSGVCTICHPDVLFSYRRDGGHTGHMMALVELL